MVKWKSYNVGKGYKHSCGPRPTPVVTNIQTARYKIPPLGNLML